MTKIKTVSQCFAAHDQEPDLASLIDWKHPQEEDLFCSAAMTYLQDRKKKPTMLDPVLTTTIFRSIGDYFIDNGLLCRYMLTTNGRQNDSIKSVRTVVVA